LAILLLDDEDGISANAYMALFDILPKDFAKKLSQQIKSANGRFYLPKGHTLNTRKCK
jgi:hypothetical protein